MSGNQLIPAAVISPTVNSLWNLLDLRQAELQRPGALPLLDQGEEAEFYDEDLSGTSSFNSTFPQMFSQSARIYWMIEYLRPGEINSYARATGDSLVDIYYEHDVREATITGQTHVYPSTVTPIPRLPTAQAIAPCCSPRRRIRCRTSSSTSMDRRRRSR